jgi:anthranilate synthase component 1
MTLPPAASVSLLDWQRRLGERAPVALLSAARGPGGLRDLLPLVEGPPLVVPYPGRPGHEEALARLRETLNGIAIGGGGEEPAGSGWILYLAYDFAHVFEPAVPCLAPALDEPLALLWRYRALAVHGGKATDAPSWRGDSDWARAQLAASTVQEPAPLLPELAVTEDEPATFLAGVARIHDYLRAGDVFQVNLSRAWRATSRDPIDPQALAQALNAANPAPFAALARQGDFAVVSSSPERLVRVHGQRIETRPIAGTRRRDADQARDAALVAELVRDPKERAEHIMLIDLERNDLGRLCVPGSVVVDELGSIESYAHVHHLVSNVSGELRTGVDAWSLLRALFPGGTITGCPKVRCMQIIAELEGVGRGAYTGSLGWIDDAGACDLNILIRTIAVKGGELVLRAGAGIVADSIGERELAETRAKARGLLRALGASG